MQCATTYIQLKSNSTYENYSVHASKTNKYSSHYRTTQSINPQFPQQRVGYAATKKDFNEQRMSFVANHDACSLRKIGSASTK